MSKNGWWARLGEQVGQVELVIACNASSSKREMQDGVGGQECQGKFFIPSVSSGRG